jgi:hypothetical protein
VVRGDAAVRIAEYLLSVRTGQAACVAAELSCSAGSTFLHIYGPGRAEKTERYDSDTCAAPGDWGVDGWTGTRVAEAGATLMLVSESATHATLG